MQKFLEQMIRQPAAGWIAIIATCLLVSACHNRDDDFFNRAVNLESATSTLDSATFTDRQWQTYFYCQGNDYWLKTRFLVKDTELLAEFDGTPSDATAVLGEILPMADIFGRYQGEFDPFSGVIRLQPEERRMVLPGMRGVYEPESGYMLLALEGESWSDCSSAIVVPASEKSRIEALLIEPDSELETFIQESLPVQVVDGLVDNLIAELDPEEPIRVCDKDMLDWLNAYLQADPAASFSALNRSQIVSRYEDKVFVPAFGKPLRDMSLEDGVLRARLMTYPKSCNLGLVANSPQWDAIVRLSYPLSNHATYGRNAIAVDSLIRSLREDWLQLSYVRLLGWARTPQMFTGQRLKGLEAMQAYLPAIEDHVWPLDLQPLAFQIDATRQQLKATYRADN